MHRIVIPAVFLLACSIPDIQFKPSPDGGTGSDIFTLVTDVAANNIITIDEAQSVYVKVHLSNQPDADVRVTVILDTGPVMANASSLVFIPQYYNVDQTITFTATVDANTVSEDQQMTLRVGSVDKLYTLHTLDRDVLSIQVLPPSLTITEQDTGGDLDVKLTQQPTANVSVTVTTMSGHVTADKSQLTFTPQNYSFYQAIHVSAPGDSDDKNDTDTVTLSTTTSGILPRDVMVSINDDDVQQILADVSSTLKVTEDDTETFGVTLKRMPASDVNVSVTSLASSVATAMPTMLQFTSTNYMTPQRVTVHGTRDDNQQTDTTMIRLFEASIGATEVPVTVDEYHPSGFGSGGGAAGCGVAPSGSNSGWIGMAMFAIAFLGLRRRGAGRPHGHASTSAANTRRNSSAHGTGPDVASHAAPSSRTARRRAQAAARGAWRAAARRPEHARVVGMGSH